MAGLSAAGMAPAAAAAAVTPSVPARAAPGSLPYPVRPDASPMYPGLATYMGMELTEDVIRANMPEYLPGQQENVAATSGAGLVSQGLNTYLVHKTV